MPVARNPGIAEPWLRYPNTLEFNPPSKYPLKFFDVPPRKIFYVLSEKHQILRCLGILTGVLRCLGSEQQAFEIVYVINIHSQLKTTINTKAAHI